MAEWEARLTEEGLPDIDLSDGETIQTTSPTRIKPEYHPEIRAEFWRRASYEAERLPHGHPRGPFIRRAAALGNVNRAAREAGLTQKAGEWAWRRFLVFAGLPAPLVKGSQGRKRPTKPGQVRIEAGRYREERAA